jgi:hypothetical protein
MRSTLRSCASTQHALLRHREVTLQYNLVLWKLFSHQVCYCTPAATHSLVYRSCTSRAFLTEISFDKFLNVFFTVHWRQTASVRTEANEADEREVRGRRGRCTAGQDQQSKEHMIRSISTSQSYGAARGRWRCSLLVLLLLLSFSKYSQLLNMLALRLRYQTMKSSQLPQTGYSVTCACNQQQLQCPVPSGNCGCVRWADAP